MNNRYNLVLSGGGARCVFQLGFLEYMYEHDIEIEAISCVSGGAIVGALIADGHKPKQALEEIKSLNLKKMKKFNFFRDGIFDYYGFKEVLDKMLSVKNIEMLSRKLYITVLSYQDTQLHYVDKGSVSDYVVASCSLFPVFSKYSIDGTEYIDGGLSNNLPIEPFCKSDYDIIGINVNPKDQYPIKNSFYNGLKRALHIYFYSSIECRKAKCNIYVEPQELASYSIFNLDTSTYDELFNIGYRYATTSFKH